MFIHRRVLRSALIAAVSLLLAVPLVNTYDLKAQAAPALNIVSPADGATVDGPVTIRVEHSGIIFDGVKIGQAPEPGVGHWHVNVDGKYAGLAVSNVLEIPNDAVPTISAGAHTITVDLHQNNHAATEPPVARTIKLNFSKAVTMSAAAGGTPSIKLVDGGSSADSGAPIVVRIEHSGIIFDGVKIGQAPEPGVGHWHVNVDGKYAGLAVSNVLEIPNDAVPTISAGAHTITVDLHQNNHAATEPPVGESFRINLSKDLTLGASEGSASGGRQDAPAPAPVDHAGHAEAPTTTAGSPMMMPNTGRRSSDRTSAILVMLLLISIGSLLVYVERRSRIRARPDR